MLPLLFCSVLTIFFYSIWIFSIFTNLWITTLCLSSVILKELFGGLQYTYLNSHRPVGVNTTLLIKTIKTLEIPVHMFLHVETANKPTQWHNFSFSILSIGSNIASTPSKQAHLPFNEVLIWLPKVCLRILKVVSKYSKVFWMTVWRL